MSDFVYPAMQERFRLHAAAAGANASEVPRLQVLALPDGRFVLVVTGGGLAPDDHETFMSLAKQVGAAETAVFTQPLEVG